MLMPSDIRDRRHEAASKMTRAHEFLSSIDVHTLKAPFTWHGIDMQTGKSLATMSPFLQGVSIHVVCIGRQ